MDMAMHLKCDDPNYDPTLELMCLMPTDLHGASVVDLAEDLKVTDEQIVQWSLEASSRHAVHFKVYGEHGAVRVRVMAQARKRMRQLAEQYWEQIYAQE